jgi:AcrR family transcriptional regulator
MTTKTPNPVGRPRAFDKEQALEAGMRVFWRQGYEGASLDTLTEAMGINRPSLYAAFGDKRSLFSQVLDRYSEGPAAYVTEALAQPTAYAVVEHLLNGAANLCTSPANPRGCLFLQSGSTCSPEAESVQREITRRRNQGNKLVIERLTRAKREGDLPPDSNPADLARYVVAILRGLGILAADGASRAELRRIIRTALRTWPTNPAT